MEFWNVEILEFAFNCWKLGRMYKPRTFKLQHPASKKWLEASNSNIFRPRIRNSTFQNSKVPKFGVLEFCILGM